ncbi:MBL fold metallo-hydrolase [Atopomonas sediminilitoris]|uniref:MBL fold metallo-hydrolase n=1 Tax=Atopomonas sediminilitoris TaxID=2919919 RepID=UPI001F4D44A9|nr:MBL fold metallo-hydrolase [Atopomonas sediminilitoris]MCJ8168136.1 MBL fold metallo-hydrolase [Atopomonas sediminilitoris]
MSNASPAPSLSSALHVGGRYRNAQRAPRRGLLDTLRIFAKFTFQRPSGTVPQDAIPVRTLTRVELDSAADGSLYRLGHSTVLLKLDGGWWLTDPVFCQRTSPVQWLGPKRFHAPPIALQDLPPLTGILLSHDHYDHLDKASLLALAPTTQHIITPTGVGERLIRWGVPAAKIQQLAWWQETHVGALTFACTPAQHFSGRGLGDGNRTLWASWAIISPKARLFFSGDSGYFAGFAEIGAQYGPFDLTLMETGAYNGDDWPEVHMLPEHSLQAHLDVRGQWLLPIHNGTFDLSMHGWREPLERISTLADAAQVKLTTPMMGEALNLYQLNSSARWWQGLR